MRHERMHYRDHRRGRREDRPGLRIEGFAAPGLIRIGGGPRMRSRRGDVRAAILLLLDEEPMHGYQLIHQIEDRSNGDWKPSPGSIYPAIAALEDEGLILIDQVDGRKTARLTAEGVDYVRANRTTFGVPWNVAGDDVGETVRDLRQLIRLLNTAAGQVAAVGSTDQLAQAARILGDARKALYRLLAEADEE